MAKVIWSDPALDDVKSIAEYIAKDSPAYAEAFVLRLVEAPRRLEAFPLCGRVVPEFENERIREIIRGAYRIIYSVSEDQCRVVAVIHGSRDALRHVEPDDWTAS